MFLQVLLTIEQHAHLDVTSTKVTQPNTLKSCITYLYLDVCEFKHIVFSTFHILRPGLPHILPPDFDFLRTIIILCSPIKSLYSHVLNSNTLFGQWT